jgi:hypothetical protein
MTAPLPMEKSPVYRLAVDVSPESQDGGGEQVPSALRPYSQSGRVQVLPFNVQFWFGGQ